MVRNAIVIEERIENLYQVLWLLKIILHSNKVLDSCPGVLQNSIKMR